VPDSSSLSDHVAEDAGRQRERLPKQTVRVNASARRQEILDTATEVFADKGIRAATVRDISERAGILSGSLYHHFASKEEMIVEILAPVITSQVEAYDRILALKLDDPIETLRRGMAVAIAQTAANPNVARILRQDEHHIRELPGLDEVRQQRRAIRTRMEHIIQTGIASGHFRNDVDPALAAFTIFDAVLGAYRHLEPIAQSTPDEVTRQLTTLILAGLSS
jgi:TetR/AcrR family transcriptional regulator, cholesterol catabolism regulator